MVISIYNGLEQCSSCPATGIQNWATGRLFSLHRRNLLGYPMVPRRTPDLDCKTTKSGWWSVIASCSIYLWMVELLTAFYQLAHLKSTLLSQWQRVAIVNSTISYNVRGVAQIQRETNFILLEKQGELDIYNGFWRCTFRIYRLHLCQSSLYKWICCS